MIKNAERDRDHAHERRGERRDAKRDEEAVEIKFVVGRRLMASASTSQASIVINRISATMPLQPRPNWLALEA